MTDGLRIIRQTAPTPVVRQLVGELEAALSAQYPQEQRHGLAVEAIFQPKIRFFVAWVGEEPVGCGGVALEDGFAELKRMYVREAWRGRGAAPALLRRLEQEARDAGTALLTLETGDAQHAALRFYRREGFAVCESFGGYLAMPAHAIATSVFMCKALAG